MDLRFGSHIAGAEQEVAGELLHTAAIQTGDDEASALLQKAPGGGETDPARAADNEATFVLQAIGHDQTCSA